MTAKRRSPARGAPVLVHVEEPALAKLVGHIARQVPGVLRLDARPPARAGRPRAAVFGQGTSDGGAVTVSRADDGVLEASLRIVTATDPAPVHVARAVVHAVSGQLAAMTGIRTRIEVVVTDVRQDA